MAHSPGDGGDNWKRPSGAAVRCCVGAFQGYTSEIFKRLARSDFMNLSTKPKSQNPHLLVRWGAPKLCRSIYFMGVRFGSQDPAMYNLAVDQGLE